MRSIFLAASVLAGAGLILTVTNGAPGPKEKKDEPLPPATEEQLAKAKDNLKQLAIAWHNYESTYGELPSNISGKDNKVLLSWRVQILPHIEEDALYKLFKLDEPWDSEHNKKLIQKMPKLYAPVRAKAESGMTFYQSFTGTHAILKPGQKVSLSTVPDGTSNTILVAESAKPVIWSKPDDLAFNGKDLPALGGMFDGKVHVAACDGAVYRLRKNIERDVLARLIDPSDGNVVSFDEAVDKEEK